jgi:dinuclear metal center YbgI/SA1388 family protein
MPETVTREELVAYLDDYLDAQEGADYGPNGLQVEGRRKISKIVTGVSACLELFERAAAADAQAVLVHHGIFWHGMPYPLTGVQYGRVSTLVRAGLNLLAYHLPLDRHPEIGNNALAAKDLGLVDREPFGDYKGLPVGYAGRFHDPVPVKELESRCFQLFGQEPLAFTNGPAQVSTVGIISGGAQKDLYRAIDAGLDAFITGEVSEWVMNLTREAGIHYLAAGHYATERLGIRALGQHVGEKFGVEVEFVDVPNPV